MNEKSKMITSLKLFILFCSVIVAISICAAPSQAATTKNQKAHKAYQTQLKKDKKEFCSSSVGLQKLPYAYKDLNGDKIDELIVRPGYGYCSEIIYTYKNGKVKKMVTLSQGGVLKFFTKKKLAYVEQGHQGVYYKEYYKIKNGKYKRVACVKEVETYNYTTDTFKHKKNYYINNKKVTKAKYNSYVKKLKGSDKGVKHSKLNWKKY